MRAAVAILGLIGSLVGIVSIFWYQELQYLMPTPVPKDYRVVLPNELIEFDSTLISRQYEKPKLLHFFSPDCPCSRFNLKHFHALSKKYRDRVDFFVVIAKHDQITSAKYMVDRHIKIVVDNGENLAKACGVYSTPQAALIQRNNKLYFRGNYNRSRYCTDKNSNFVQMALDSLMSQKKPPHFSELATQAYGCTLSQKPDILIQ